MAIPTNAIQSALKGQKALPLPLSKMLHLRWNVPYDEELIDPTVCGGSSYRSQKYLGDLVINEMSRCRASLAIHGGAP
jgi:hypothetical protein